MCDKKSKMNLLYLKTVDLHPAKLIHVSLVVKDIIVILY